MLYINETMMHCIQAFGYDDFIDVIFPWMRPWGTASRGFQALDYDEFIDVIFPWLRPW